MLNEPNSAALRILMEHFHAREAQVPRLLTPADIDAGSVCAVLDAGCPPRPEDVTVVQAYLMGPDRHPHIRPNKADIVQALYNLHEKTQPAPAP